MAQSLGAGFLKHGYEVMLGTRDILKLSKWQAGDGKGAQIGSFAEAAAFGNIVVLATKGTAALAARGSRVTFCLTRNGSTTLT